MSAQGDLVDQLIDQYVRNYARDAFHDLRLNRILHLLRGLADSSGGGVAGPGSNLVPVTSADFSNATDCPIPALNGATIEIFFNENNKFIEKDLGEWTDLVGGGFRILISGFNKADANYHFKVYTV